MDDLIHSIATSLSYLKVSFTESEIATLVLSQTLSEDQLKIIEKFCKMVQTKETIVKRTKILKFSRLSVADPRTFDNFDTEVFSEKAKKEINNLKTLAFLDAKRNVILVGPTGIGKTHLAQAIGNECVNREIRVFFIKLRELQKKIAIAINDKKVSYLIGRLTKFPCLIIDEVGYCKFSIEESRVFFQIIDAFESSNYGSIILTSNLDLNKWDDLFGDLDALESSLDRINNNSLYISMTGNSYRGKRGKTYFLMQLSK